MFFQWGGPALIRNSAGAPARRSSCPRWLMLVEPGDILWLSGVEKDLELRVADAPAMVGARNVCLEDLFETRLQQLLYCFRAQPAQLQAREDETVP